MKQTHQSKTHKDKLPAEQYYDQRGDVGLTVSLLIILIVALITVILQITGIVKLM